MGAAQSTPPAEAPAAGAESQAPPAAPAAPSGVPAAAPTGGKARHEASAAASDDEAAKAADKASPEKRLSKEEARQKCHVENLVVQLCITERFHENWCKEEQSAFWKCYSDARGYDFDNASSFDDYLPHSVREKLEAGREKLLNFVYSAQGNYVPPSKRDVTKPTQSDTSTDTSNDAGDK